MHLNCSEQIYASIDLLRTHNKNSELPWSQTIREVKLIRSTIEVCL